MILLFHCYSGNHTSITAANIYLGRLPRDRRPRYRDILGQPGFDRLPHTQVGRPVYLGADSAGRQVWCVGLGAGKGRLAGALVQFLGALGVRTQDDVLLVDALVNASFLTRVGGFLSRRARLVCVGRPLVALGVWLSYSRYLASHRRLAGQPAATGPPPSG